MRPPRDFRPDRGSPRLFRVRRGDREELWTQTVGTPPVVYGERWSDVGEQAYRSFEPARSKLSAALVKGWTGPLPRVGERWLYLGAASGTTASHVADLLGPGGRVYAVERSVRPFARLMIVAGRWPTLLPILADARDPFGYAGLVPPVDGVYADIAQPDQVDILLQNAALLLRGRGSRVLIALKTASMGRDATALEHVRQAETALSDRIDLVPTVRLDPFHRGHYLVGGVAAPSLFDDRPPMVRPPPPARSRERRRS
jgi:fibrillarin-like pre-rRNA processing protein